MVPSELSKLWCGNHTDPVLMSFINPEGLNCEDLLEGVVPELDELANSLRLGIEVPSQDLSGVWFTFRGSEPALASTSQ
jgi:hypothetical protein